MRLKNGCVFALSVAACALSFSCIDDPPESATQTIGSEGGTVKLGEVSLVVPSGALGAEVELAKVVCPGAAGKATVSKTDAFFLKLIDTLCTERPDFCNPKETQDGWTPTPKSTPIGTRG